MSKWATELTHQIAANIKQRRGNRSGQWLSDRTAELGHRVSRTTISELENGRRGTIALDAIIVIAAALEVPVSWLIWPLDGPDIVEALPGQEVPRVQAMEMLGGTVTEFDGLLDLVNDQAREIEMLRRKADEIYSRIAQRIKDAR